jgi:signal transduction histidine kinase
VTPAGVAGAEDLSHELRTAATNILGYLELLEDERELGPDAHRFLDALERNAERLRAAVHSIRRG